MRFALMATALSFVAGTTSATEWNFDTTKVGALPDGWETAKTGAGPGSVWKVVEDESAPSGKHALAQVSSEGPNPLYNQCVTNQPRLQDVDISVRLNANSGKIDQGGGVVWRYQDANNYYIARANPLESNYRVYKVVKGKRQQLDSADVPVPSGKWVALRVVHKGNHIACYLEGKLLLEADDSDFVGPGQVGLWSKADAATSFDDLKAAVP